MTASTLHPLSLGHEVAVVFTIRNVLMNFLSKSLWAILSDSKLTQPSTVILPRIRKPLYGHSYFPSQTANILKTLLNLNVSPLLRPEIFKSKVNSFHSLLLLFLRSPLHQVTPHFVSKQIERKDTTDFTGRHFGELLQEHYCSIPQGIFCESNVYT